MSAADRKCPFPIMGDDGTVAQCVANGHCGCDEFISITIALDEPIFHDDKPDGRPDMHVSTGPGDLDCAGRPLKEGT